MNIRALVVLALSPALGVAGCGSDGGGGGESPTAVSPAGAFIDYWSPTVVLRTTEPSGAPSYFAPIHAVVMPDGRVCLMGYSKLNPLSEASDHGVAGVFTPTPWNVAPPAELQVPRGNNAFDIYPSYFDGRYFVRDSLFCSGHTLLGDGRLLTVGGTRYVNDTETSILYLLGLHHSLLFDGATWTRGPNHVGTAALGGPFRWYSTATRLADGRVLAVSGYDLAEAIYGGNIIPGTQLQNRSVEAYDPSTNAWSIVSPHAASPSQIFNPDYTHAFQLPVEPSPGADVLMLGGAGVPVLMSSATGGWTVRSSQPRPGSGGTSGHGVSTVLLPIRLADGQWGYSNGSVMLAGGAHGTAYEHGIDAYDPVADAWLPRVEMEVRRHHPMTVLLPDGRVLIVAGHDDVTPLNPETRHAQIVDTLNGRAVYRGVSEVPERRGYHACSVLLPDGRVLVAGGRDGGSDSPELEKTTLRYYYPWYFFVARPQITSAPATIAYDATFSVGYAGMTPPSEVVLMGLGSMTHSFDMNQRHVQLAAMPGAPGSLTVTAPPDGRVAPPGYYMLFVLAANRAPSEARLVRLE
jgi:hypothetical protein